MTSPTISSWVSELAGILAPLMRDGRPDLAHVRFIGSETELLAFASDGHVLVFVTALGNFKHVGDAVLHCEFARRIGHRDWSHEPWDDPEQDKHLKAEALLEPVTADRGLPLEKAWRVMPGSRPPARSAGFFLGPALKTLGTVLDRLGLQVQFSGSDGPLEPIRFDSPPMRSTEGDLFWVSGAVMPSRYPEGKP